MTYFLWFLVFMLAGACYELWRDLRAERSLRKANYEAWDKEHRAHALTKQTLQSMINSYQLEQQLKEAAERQLVLVHQVLDAWRERLPREIDMLRESLISPQPPDSVHTS